MILFSILISTALAVTVTVEHPVDGVIAMDEIAITEPTSVGLLTMDYLTQKNIVFDGSELGFMSIAGLEQRLDILSKSEMKAYGWCYSVDGQIPETLAHETMLTSDSSLRWFYAFAHYQSGVWLSQCEEE